MQMIIEPTKEILTIDNGRRVRVWHGQTDDGRDVYAFLIGFCASGEDSLVKEGEIIDDTFEVPPEVEAFMESKLSP